MRKVHETVTASTLEIHVSNNDDLKIRLTQVMTSKNLHDQKFLCITQLYKIEKKILHKRCIMTEICHIRDHIE